jgi:hypothetical protein
VRLGVSLRSGYYLVDDPRIGARWMVEQNTPMLGRLLAEWSDRPAGALFLLPLWNPVLVAEQVGTLAAIAAGRSSCGRWPHWVSPT